MEGEGKSVKQQPLSIAQATEDAKCGRRLGFRQSLACWAVNERGSVWVQDVWCSDVGMTWPPSTLLSPPPHRTWSEIGRKLVLNKSCGRFTCVSKYSWYHIVSYSFEDAWQSEPQNRKGKHLITESPFPCSSLFCGCSTHPCCWLPTLHV